MPIVKVEALVKAQKPANEKGMQQYDIITIQPTGAPWGIGDLCGRFVFCLELDIPCGADFMSKKRCAQCEHQGISWESESLSEGTIGHPKEICPIQKYQVADAQFVFHIDAKGIPNVETVLSKKRKYRLNYSTILSPLTKDAVENESVQLSVETVNSRLTTARKESNMITESVISIKSILEK